jgi:Protein of unknown function (DUF4019)
MFRCIFTVVLSSAFSLSLIAEAASPTTAEQPAAATQAPAGQGFFTQKVLEDSAAAAMAWLKLVDANKYGESWDKTATLTKLTITRDEWIKTLEVTRRPLGSVTSRQVLDQRTAIDPSGMPKGYYIVMFYKTVFSHKTAFELLTLYLEDNQWSVLTYQVQTQ